MKPCGSFSCLPKDTCKNSILSSVIASGNGIHSGADDDDAHIVIASIQTKPPRKTPGMKHMGKRTRLHRAGVALATASDARNSNASSDNKKESRADSETD